jgi:phage internal scaffolding protein
MFRTAYGEKQRVTLDFDQDDPGLTQQEFKNECDVNLIVDKYQRTGLLTHVAATTGTFMAAPQMDFQEALNYVRDAEEAFMNLPSEIRKEFNNDPAVMIDFCQDPVNLPKLEEMGLLDPEKLRQKKLKAETKEPDAAAVNGA